MMFPWKIFMNNDSKKRTFLYSSYRSVIYIDVNFGEINLFTPWMEDNKFGLVGVDSKLVCIKPGRDMRKLLINNVY